jgi:TIGR03009 family protein
MPQFSRSAVLAIAVVFSISAPIPVEAQVTPPAKRAPRTPRTPNAAADQPENEQAGAVRQGPSPANDPDAAPARPSASSPANAPFQLTAAEEHQLDELLAAWERRSAKIKKLKAEFTRWEYDAVFGKRDDEGNIVPKESHGEIHFSAPDKGSYEVHGEGGEHWICDGSSIFEFNAQKKQIIERILPPELQGRAISESPLPFLFGADAARQKQRYFLRIVTPGTVQGQVWLEAWPRYVADAANFQRATVILDQKELLPYALEIVLPNGKNKTVHQFDKRAVNSVLGFLEGNPFKPSLPSGWSRVVENATPAAGPAPPENGTVPATTRRKASRSGSAIPR